MDLLSQLLALYPSQGTLDLRCELHAPWALSHEAAEAGVAPYHVIVSGKATMEIPGRKPQALTAGDIVILPGGAAHRLHAGSSVEEPLPIRELTSAQGIGIKQTAGEGEQTDILCGQFHFQPGSTNILMSALPDVVVVSTKHRRDSAQLRVLTAMMRQEADNEQPGASAMVDQLSTLLLTLLLRAWIEQADSERGLFGLLADRRLQPAFKEIIARPERDWRLKDMARLCHMSRATFARVVAQITDTPPAAMLAEFRMAHAAALLRRNGQSIAAISEAVGYQSEAAFSRAFKKSVGSSPGAYRRAHQLEKCLV